VAIEAGAFEDAANNPYAGIADKTTWSFTTEAALDTIPPTVSDGTIGTGGLSETGVTLSWTKATDNVSIQSALQYLVYRSGSNNLSTVSDIEANGTAVGSYASDIGTLGVTGLTGGATYYFNVIVKDEAGNRSVYTTKQVTTPTPPNAAPTASNLNITGTAQVGQTLTGTYSYTDAEDDAEGVSTYKW
jgi:hypothetical protein